MFVALCIFTSAGSKTKSQALSGAKCLIGPLSPELRKTRANRRRYTMEHFDFVCVSLELSSRSREKRFSCPLPVSAFFKPELLIETNLNETCDRVPQGR